VYLQEEGWKSRIAKRCRVLLFDDVLAVSAPVEKCNVATK
jgi:hypothetical protein